jgi:hypothetical protein
MKLKFAKPKKVSISKLKKKAWDVFSLYIRTKYADPMGGVVCYTCERLFTIKTTQAGHGIAGRNNAVLFCEPLVRPQCVGCNFFGGGKYAIFMDKLIKEYGAEKFSQLVMMSTMTVQRKAQDYIDIYETYRQKLAELGEV